MALYCCVLWVAHIYLWYWIRYNQATFNVIFNIIHWYNLFADWRVNFLHWISNLLMLTIYQPFNIFCIWFTSMLTVSKHSHCLLEVKSTIYPPAIPLGQHLFSVNLGLGVFALLITPATFCLIYGAFFCSKPFVATLGARIYLLFTEFPRVRSII